MLEFRTRKIKGTYEHLVGVFLVKIVISCIKVNSFQNNDITFATIEFF